MKDEVCPQADAGRGRIEQKQRRLALVKEEERKGLLPEGAGEVEGEQALVVEKSVTNDDGRKEEGQSAKGGAASVA